MRNLAFLELRLEKLTISKPLRAKNPTIYIIMQDFYLAIVLGIKDKSLIVISRIMSHDITHYRSQSFISLTHVGRSGLLKNLVLLSKFIMAATFYAAILPRQTNYYSLSLSALHQEISELRSPLARLLALEQHPL